MDEAKRTLKPFFVGLGVAAVLVLVGGEPEEKGGEQETNVSTDMYDAMNLEGPVEGFNRRALSSEAQEAYASLSPEGKEVYERAYLKAISSGHQHSAESSDDGREHSTKSTDSFRSASSDAEADGRDRSSQAWAMCKRVLRQQAPYGVDFSMFDMEVREEGAGYLVIADADVTNAHGAERELRGYCAMTYKGAHGSDWQDFANWEVQESGFVVPRG
jgi:hypothetical protein